jgi:hypothetical protein
MKVPIAGHIEKWEKRQIIQQHEEGPQGIEY